MTEKENVEDETNLKGENSEKPASTKEPGDESVEKPSGIKPENTTSATVSLSHIKSSKEQSTLGITNDSTLEEGSAFRQIIAEDKNYNLENVKSLKDLALNHTIENFAFNYSALPFLDPDQRRHVLDSISTETPLKVTAHLIPEDPYWKRCCIKRWTVVDVVKHGNSWKRAFFEKYIEQMIQEYVPGLTYNVWIIEALGFAAPYVKRLDIKEMLPPVKKEPKLKKMKDEDADSDEDDSEDSEDELSEIQVDHLDLGSVVAKLNLMEHLGVQYRVKNTGLNFEWSQFQFTGRDCINFSKAIQLHTSLSILELTKSRVDCERVRVMVGHLMDHPTLRVLNLSHNIISDWGTRALAKLINGRSQIECLNLMDNKLTAEGGIALSFALTKGAKKMTRLNLRLNRLGDGGASALARSLLKNETLKELNLATNMITDSAVLIFAQCLIHNDSLQKLDLSNNKIGPETGRKLQESLISNQALIFLDIRFTGCPQVSEFTLQQTIEANDNRLRLLTEKKETGVVKLPSIISVAVEEVMPTFEKSKHRQSFFSTGK